MPNRPRILVAAPLPPPLVGQSIMTAMAVEALREVADVTVVDTSAPALLKPSALRLGRATAWLRMLREYRAALRRSEPEIVYMTPSSSPLGLFRDLALLRATPRRVRIVGHLHVGDYDRLLAHPVFGRAARGVLRRTDPLIACSAYAARGLARACPALPPATVVHNAAPPGRALTDAEREAKWARRAQTVLLLANALPGKGHVLLAEAAALLPARGETQFIVAGGWPSEAARRGYESQLKTLGVAARFDVRGVVEAEAVRALLAEADVLAFPSTYRHESLSVAVLEAMAAGCAVVAVDHAGASEMVRDEVEGRLVANEAEAFAAGLADALQHAERYGRAAAARAAQEFDAERFAEGIHCAVLG